MIDRKSFEPMYQQIKRDIEQQILSGEIKIGDKLMSETEMLEHYHVARMTVRAALTELVNNGCLAKERGRGTFCVALPRQEKKSIDVLLDTGDNYFTPYFLSGISRVLDREGYQLVLNDTRDTVEMFEKLLQQIISRGTSGIIIQPYRRVQDISEELLRELESCQAAGIPVVTIDGKFRDHSGGAGTSRSAHGFGTTSISPSAATARRARSGIAIFSSFGRRRACGTARRGIFCSGGCCLRYF